MESNLMTIDEVCALLRISVPTFRKLRKEKKLPMVGSGKVIRFDRNSIISALTQNGGTNV